MSEEERQKFNPREGNPATPESAYGTYNFNHTQPGEPKSWYAINYCCSLCRHRAQFISNTPIAAQHQMFCDTCLTKLRESAGIIQQNKTMEL